MTEVSAVGYTLIVMVKNLTLTLFPKHPALNRFLSRVLEYVFGLLVIAGFIGLMYLSSLILPKSQEDLSGEIDDTQPISEYFGEQ